MNMKAIKIFSIVGIIWGLTACGIMGGFNEEGLKGRYEGTFQRTIDGNSEGEAEVWIVFEGGNFNGSSEHRNFPAICAGSYSISRSTIKFSNTCFFTADFDWTLILAGDFRVERSGEALILSKSDGVTVDRYRLVRKD